MTSVLRQLVVNVRLYFRNPMALLYGYLFPTIFLVAFWVLYRYEPVPLVRHMGELLTITALGGACFGLPTAMVSERERGVWRRYRLTPVPTASLVASTVLARYFLLITAALLQLALTLMIGMPLPQHPLDLWLAFTFVSFAFLGLGLVIAMLADTVPAVQALGQCIFLPMLIIGGVAVRLESLPVWAQHVSAFFPGRYAVDAIQVSVTGEGLGAARFSLVALLFIGLAGSITGAKLFRWDANERFVSRAGKSWIAVALAAWVAVGLVAETSGRIAITPTGSDRSDSTAVASNVLLPDSGAAVTAASPLQPATPPETTDTRANASQSIPSTVAVDTSTDATTVDTESSATTSTETTRETASSMATWQSVTLDDIERDLDFDNLPPDAGRIAPIAASTDSVSTALAEQLQCLRANLPFWQPGNVGDLVQRTRNFLYVAAVPDMFRMQELERWAPRAVFSQLQYEIPENELIKILYWIATHPDEGQDAAANQLRAVCIDIGGPSDVQTLRERKRMYALKLLGRLTGQIVPQ